MGMVAIRLCYLQYVSKRASLSVGIVAVLVAGFLPAGDACALGVANGHGCCASPEPEPTSSCCAHFDAPAPSPETDKAMDCTCDHPPASPATVAVTSSPSSTEDDGLPAHTAHVEVTHETSTRVRVVEHRVRSHPPPPAYLLNCANLN